MGSCRKTRLLWRRRALLTCFFDTLIGISLNRVSDKRKAGWPSCRDEVSFYLLSMEGMVGSLRGTPVMDLSRQSKAGQRYLGRVATETSCVATPTRPPTSKQAKRYLETQLHCLKKRCRDSSQAWDII